MNLYSKNDIQNLLAANGILPKKQLGQNFLLSPGIIQALVESAQISSSDSILEIGPGIGTLTIELARTAKKVVAIEKDPNLATITRQSVKQYGNVEIKEGDALEWEFDNSLETPYKIVSNLPYYITSPTIKRFLEDIRPQPSLMALIVQKEVAQRICAKPPNMSILAVAVQLFAKAEIVRYVKRGSFWPSPNVDSAILCLFPTDIYTREIGNISLFFKIVKAGFLHPRRHLINNLAGALEFPKDRVSQWLAQNSIKENRRAETLSVGDWINLAKTVQ
ncbi:MAG: ribosomal RNA small subunit methyltransferase A [Candidatus Wildermuthbacteria bacterium]|nr:ribosomal RNA small subunit methyltransferase A [Candidatus Wildermuthbacteria bacterium]